MKVYELKFESTYRVEPRSNDYETSSFTHYAAASDFDSVMSYVKEYQDKCHGVPELLSVRELGYLYGVTNDT